MSKIVKGVYQRRNPECSDYYRMIETYYEEFERCYSDCFEEKQGYLRAEVMKAIYNFLDCGIPENGVARVRCDDCGHNFFVAFSCRCRVICPSCSTKRSLLFGEKVAEMTKPLPHLHITFTIPKILRAYFKRNRKLLKFLVQSANFAMNTYFKESLGIDDGYSGGIYCVQTQGSLYNFHPHVHALVLGGILKDGVFTAEKHPSSQLITRLFRARLLKVLIEEGVIQEELVDMLLSWNHNSGFNVHLGGKKISGSNETRIEQVSRYMSRAAISVERVEFDPTEQAVTVYEKQEQPSSGMMANLSKSYPILEFLGLLACHIPSTYESLVYYYGVYSSSYRGKEKKAEIKEGDTEVIEEQGKAKRKACSTWARLIKKVFEFDPLQCPVCCTEMRIIAFITDYREIRKILKHIEEETVRPPPLEEAVINLIAKAQPEISEMSFEQETAYPSLEGAF